MADFDDIKIEDVVDIAGINSAISKLCENDTSMTINGFAPTIWECKWFNSADNEKSRLGYKKGDAVWINTEDIDSFVSLNLQSLKKYLSQYPKTHETIENIGNDSSKLQEFCKKFVNGENQYDDEHRYIYYIGNLSEKVQIRVSKKDENIDLPTSDSWGDFIRRDLTEDYYKGVIRQIFENRLNEIYQQHLDKYHVQTAIGTDKQYKTIQDYVGKYAGNDFSNISKNQKLTSHEYTKRTEGFDSIYLSNVSRSGKTCKWFKLWKSGMLEHGGTIDVDQPTLGDYIESDGNAYSVSLNWTYGIQNAPCYDYTENQSSLLFQTDTGMLIGESECDYPNINKQMEEEQQYSVQVTGIGELSCDPYSKCDGVNPTYCSYDTVTVENDRFSFVIAKGIRKYSYYVRGFKTNF